VNHFPATSACRRSEHLSTTGQRPSRWLRDRTNLLCDTADTPNDPTRRLVLLRNADAEWSDTDDHEHPLAQRGRTDAPVAGRWLAGCGITSGPCLRSSAASCRGIWKLAVQQLPERPRTVYRTSLGWPIRPRPSTARRAARSVVVPIGTGELPRLVGAPPQAVPRSPRGEFGNTHGDNTVESQEILDTRVSGHP
jgi:hypothetical protein